MVLTTPLIERLAREGQVHVVATPANAAVLANHPAVSSVIVFDKRGDDRGVGGLRRVAAALRATGAQRAFLAQGSLRTAALAWLAGIPERVGFGRSSGRLLYTTRVHYAAGEHHALRLWRLADGPSATAAPRDLRPTLFPGPADEATVSALLAKHAVSDDAPLMALAPGSVWATKRWPSYDALAAALVRAHALPGLRLVVLGAAGDAPLALAIAGAVAAAGGTPVIDATGRLSLLGSAALLGRCRVLVTNDSAPLHLASAMNTPTVALFGPTVPAMGFGPLATRHITLGVETLSCRPCHAHGPMQCPERHWRCMRDLSAETVAQRVQQLVD